MFDDTQDGPSEEPLLSGRPLGDLARQITAGAVRLAAATAAWLRLVAEFDERGGWHGYGIKSCGHWLAWQCGLSPGTAREHVRVARALQRLPRIEAAFAEGRLSYAKVRALTRIAEPDIEEPLLEAAVELTASQLERTVRQWRRADGANKGADPPEAAQQFEYWWDDAGMLTLQVRMPTEPGAALLTAINSLAERAARRERAQNKKARAALSHAPAPDPDLEDRCADDAEVGLARERTAARRVAALASLAEVAVDADRRAGDPPRREVVVHVDATVIADDAAAGRAYLEGGPALTPAQARRMLCEASVTTMLEKGREVLAVGRTRRRATKAQRKALLRRDGGCARPGCPEARIERLHAHHLRHWLHGGRTDLANLVLLCDADHGLAHDLDLVMARRDGRLVVTAADGRRVWGTADAAFAGGLAGLAGGAAVERVDVVGVHPLDTEVGRRPADAPPREPVPDDGVRTTQEPRPAAGTIGRVPAGGSAGGAGIRRRRGRRLATRRPAPGPGQPHAARPGSGSPRPPEAPARRADAGRPGSTAPPRRTVTGGRARRRLVPARPSIGATLFPGGEPALPEAMHVNGARMDVAYVVGVLMGNRDLVRRLAAESGVAVAG